MRGILGVYGKLDELEELVSTAGAVVVGRVVHDIENKRYLSGGILRPADV